MSDNLFSALIDHKIINKKLQKDLPFGQVIKVLALKSLFISLLLGIISKKQ